MHHYHAALRLEIAEITPAFREKSVANHLTRHAGAAAISVAGWVRRLEVCRRLSIAIVAGRTLAIAVLVKVGGNSEIAIDQMITVSLYLKIYRRNFDRFCAELRQACSAAQVDYHLLRTDTPVDRALGIYLTKRLDRK